MRRSGRRWVSLPPWLKPFQHLIELDNPDLGNHRLRSAQDEGIQPATVTTNLFPAPGLHIALTKWVAAPLRIVSDSR